MSLLKGIDLEKKDGSIVKSDDVLANAKVVLLYFAAHWCPPCLIFTPSLRDFYKAVKEENVVIIFVSSDQSETDMESYFKSEHHDDYYAIPFNNTGAVAGLKKACQVSDMGGIPKLCLVDKDGNLKFGEVRGMVNTKDPQTVLKQLIEML